MKVRIAITEAGIIDNHLVVKTAEPVDLSSLTPKGQVLVDSDGAAFIYITENQDEYTYISLPESIWPTLKDAWGRKVPVILAADNKKLELTGLFDELAYLIDNIQGNGNYGEEFVSKVEQTFL